MSRLIAASMIALASTGCLTWDTTVVQVRDSSRVEVTSERGDPIVNESHGSGVVDRGEVWLWGKYEIRASREESGAIVLRCVRCDPDPFFYRVRPRIALLDGEGRTAPVSSSSVDIRPSAVQLGFDECVLRRKSCHLPVRGNLVIPMSDVVEVRRRTAPFRAAGVVFVGMALILGVGAVAMPIKPTLEGFALRGALAGASAGIGWLGLWHLLTPEKEQVWTPSEID